LADMSYEDFEARGPTPGRGRRTAGGIPGRARGGVVSGREPVYIVGEGGQEEIVINPQQPDNALRPHQEPLGRLVWLPMRRPGPFSPSSQTTSQRLRVAFRVSPLPSPPSTNAPFQATQ
jgi:hypothetical protein